MTLKNQAILSRYKKLTPIDSHHSVWLVRDLETSEIRILKELEGASSRVYTRLRQANIQGIPEIYELIELDDERMIVVEEYIHGETATQYFSHQENRNEEEVIACALSICETLKALHALKPAIVCRDIKPSNIMIQSAKWYITDFDIAREYDPTDSQDTRLLGTVEYAPPEQYGFGQTDERSDIYSLAITMNVLLTGKYPNEELAQGELGKVIRKATQIDPDSRYRSVEAFSRAIRFRKSRLVARLSRPSTWIAIVMYSIFLVFVLKEDYNSLENEPMTGIRYYACALAVFLAALIPYLYNANYFGLLERMMRPFRGNRLVYWLMRVLFTVLLSFAIPEVMVLMATYL